MIAPVVSCSVKPRDCLMVKIEMAITVIKNNDCNASVHTMVLIPDLLLYSQIRINTTRMVIKYGICSASKKAYCRILIDKSNRSAAPKDWETRKKRDPVL